MSLYRTTAMFILIVVAVFDTALAATALPGGANSLRESYDDWILNCRVQPSTEGAAAAVACALTQELFRQRNRQRVVALTLVRREGGIRGTLLMPFGLSLAAGVKLRIDDGPQTQAIAFRTCTPQGCVIPIDWSDNTVVGLRTGSQLRIDAVSENDQPINFNISLNGFSASLDRVIELTR